MLKKIFFSVLLVILLMIVSSTIVFAADINYDAAEKLAIDFLTDINLADILSPEHVVDFSKYTSVEKFIEYMDIHMKWIVDYNQLIGGSGYGTSYDDYTFEAKATDFEEVDGGLLITMHINRWYHYIDSNDWGGGEYSVYVLVAEGKNGLEIRDYNYPHTSWDGIRGDNYIPKDVNYWIDSPDIEPALEYARRIYAEGLKINAQEHEPKEEDKTIDSEVLEPSPQTGIAFSTIGILLPLIVLVMTLKTRKEYFK